MKLVRTLIRICCFVLVILCRQLSAKPRLGFSYSPGYLTAQGALAHALSAQWEYPLGARVALRSDAYALLARPQESNLVQNYQGFVGLVYYFDRWLGCEPFAGFQPGFGFGKVEAPANPGFRLYPAMSPFFGLHFPLSESLQITLALRYVFGELHYRDTGAVYLSELRATFGFGVVFGDNK